MILSLVCLAVAALCYAVSQLQQHGKLVWSSPVRPFGFWGERSDVRKYKPGTHEPAFPLSTTLLVFVTDGYHFMQWLMKIFIALAFVPFVGWWWSLGYWTVFTVVFAAGYKFMQR